MGATSGTTASIRFVISATNADASEERPVSSPSSLICLYTSSMVAAAAPVHTVILRLEIDSNCSVILFMSFEIRTTSGSYARIASTLGS